MTTSKFFRTFLIGGALVAALSANAVSIIIDSVGGSTGIIGSDVLFSESVLAQIGGFGHLDHLYYDIDVASNPLAGTGEYVGHHGDLDFSFTYLDGSLSGNGGSLEGIWTYTGGTGRYADLTGGGTLALTGQLDHYGLATITSFQGNLQCVPEPAPFAALGLGALGLVIRRRKKA